MLDTVIIGGGLCGVALARQLWQQNVSFALYDARERLGGRILSVPCPKNGVTVDLGPTWFWPDTQPLITQLVGDLGLTSFLQHDEGPVLHLQEADKNAQPLQNQGVHGGARRVEGGMASLITALMTDLPVAQFHLGHVLTRVRDAGDHVVLTFKAAAGGGELQVPARHAVLAIPPRLVEETISFEPALDEATLEAMRCADTWMAAQAKVVITYDAPHWRKEDKSGNAFVTHEQAVVGEIFDACDAAGTAAALGGFLALPPDQRDAFEAGLPILMTSQMTQVFGGTLEAGGEIYYQDWAHEPFTCSSRDRAAPAAEHSGSANPMLRRPLWAGRLELGGSETAAQGAGYLEGALEAARRIDRSLARGRAGQAEAPEAKAGLPVNEASIARFASWVALQNDAAFDSYRIRLNKGLAAQQREQLTQRAMLGAMEEVYEKALGMLAGLDFDLSDVPVEQGRCALMTDVQKPFRNVMQTLLDDVVAFNRTSCALSNFPGEHHLSKDYVQTILRDIAAAWQDFSLAANRTLLAKAKEPPRPSQPQNEERTPV